MQHPVLKDVLHPKIQPQGFCSMEVIIPCALVEANDQQDTPQLIATF